MELTDLARKQKRLQHWTRRLERGEKFLDEELRARFFEVLRCYRNLLAKVWEHAEISQEDSDHLVDLERRLEELDWDTRLAG